MIPIRAYTHSFFYLTGIMRCSILPYFIGFFALLFGFEDHLGAQENTINDYEVVVNNEEADGEIPAHKRYRLELATTMVWGECQTDTVFQVIDGDQVNLNFVQEIGTNFPVNQCQLPYILEVPDGDWTFNVQLSIPGFPDPLVQDSISFDYTIEESLFTGIETAEADPNWILYSSDEIVREIFDVRGKQIGTYQSQFNWQNVYDTLPSGLLFVRARAGERMGTLKIYKSLR